MDFDPERQEFTLSDREMRVMRLHPAWGVFAVSKVPALYAYVIGQATTNFNAIPRQAHRKVEIRRQLVARDMAQVIIAQLEPFLPTADDVPDFPPGPTLE